MRRTRAGLLGVVAALVGGAALFAVAGPILAQTPDESPARPTGLTGSVAHDAVSLSWDDPGTRASRGTRYCAGTGRCTKWGTSRSTLRTPAAPRRPTPTGGRTRGQLCLSGESPQRRWAERARQLLPGRYAVGAEQPGHQRPRHHRNGAGGGDAEGGRLGHRDADGLSGATYNYQWIANDGSADADIQDATGETYTLAADDEGKTIKVRVSFTDDAGHDETLSSAATGEVSPANSPATGVPAITGTAQVGETLTADTSSIADEDGLNSATFSYQWMIVLETAARTFRTLRTFPTPLLPPMKAIPSGCG